MFQHSTSVEIVSSLRPSPAPANMKPLPQQTQPRPRFQTLVMLLIDCVKCETFFFILVISKCFLFRSELADQTSCMFTFQNKVHSNVHQPFMLCIDVVSSLCLSKMNFGLSAEKKTAGHDQASSSCHCALKDFPDQFPSRGQNRILSCCCWFGFSLS